MITKKIASSLDKFYTKPSIAEYISKNRLVEAILDRSFTFECSAGGGAFMPYCQVGYDILPEAEGIIQSDFLELDIEKELKKLNVEGKKIACLSNPPFGKRCSLAIDFFNKCSDVCDYIIFVIPRTFTKYSIQKQLDSRMKLVYSELLPENSFTFMGNDYDVRCVVQIWCKEAKIDLRRKTAPPIKHADFETYQYNNTPEALKFFDVERYPWQFAVYRQGYQDYSVRFYPKDVEDMPKNKQYMFINPLSDKAYKRLHDEIDYSELSKINLSTPGFGKNDLVEYYIEFYGE